MILLLKLPLIGDFPAGHGADDRTVFFLIQWTTLDQGLARSARASDANSSSGNRWVGPPAFARTPRCGGGCGCWWQGDISQGTQAPYSEYEGGLGPWALNFKRIRNIFHSLASNEVSWLWGLTDVSTITHHRFELAMGGPWCWKPPAASSQEQSLFLIPSPFFQEVSSFPLSVYAISPGLVDKNHPISRTSSGYTLHTWHPLLFEASGCPSRSLASQAAEHGTCQVVEIYCWEWILIYSNSRDLES